MNSHITSNSAALDDAQHSGDGVAWTIVRHVAVFGFCALAVTLALLPHISLLVSIGWGVTGLAMLVVMVAADRAQFIATGWRHEPVRLDVVEPARPLAVGSSDVLPPAAAFPLSFPGTGVSVPQPAVTGAMHAGGLSPEPFQITVT